MKQSDAPSGPLAFTHSAPAAAPGDAPKPSPGVVTPQRVAAAPVQRAGVAAVPPPGNRFLVCTEANQVRVRGLPLGRLSATEARALAAHLAAAADEVAQPGDQEFSDLYAALMRERESKTPG